jgi:hypothetical protein
MKSILERGREQSRQRDAEVEQRRQYQIDEGIRQIRKAFAFRFYEETLVNDRGLRVLGPESPDPEIHYEGTMGSLGGAYLDVVWRFKHEGIDWKAEYKWSSPWRSYDLDFYVRRRCQWLKVYSPAHVYEALS